MCVCCQDTSVQHIPTSDMVVLAASSSILLSTSVDGKSRIVFHIHTLMHTHTACIPAQKGCTGCVSKYSCLVAACCCASACVQQHSLWPFVYKTNTPTHTQGWCTKLACSSFRLRARSSLLHTLQNCAYSRSRAGQSGPRWMLSGLRRCLDTPGGDMAGGWGRSEMVSKANTRTIKSRTLQHVFIVSVY